MVLTRIPHQFLRDPKRNPREQLIVDQAAQELTMEIAP
jgi:hypothetical protein